MADNSIGKSASSIDSGSNAHLLVDGEWLSQRLDDANVRIVDLRARESYDQGHIPGALSAPLPLFRATIDGVPGMAIPQQEFERLMGELGISTDMTVVGYDDSGGLDAGRFLWTMELYGHPDTRVLNGTTALWQREGHPLVASQPTVSPTYYRATRHPEKVATLAEVRSVLGNAAVTLLDTRTPDEYAGRKGDTPRNGHIPGAVNVDWVNNLVPDGAGQIRPVAELADIYTSAGVTPDREVITYCRTGHRASHAYFVLRLLGYPRVRLYDGSWSEWSAHPDVPLER